MMLHFCRARLAEDISSDDPTTLQQITRVPVFLQQILPYSEAICEISQNFAALLSPNTYIPWPVGVVVLNDNASKYKEFILTCNTKTQAIKVSLQRLDFIL